MLTNYAYEYNRSLANPEAFWAEQAGRISWFRQPAVTLHHTDNNLFHWYHDGTLNTSYLCLDYHIEQGRGEQTALIYDSPVTGTVQHFTYTVLRDKVAAFAARLRALGVSKGDTVVIYMPMIPETVVAMLACARLGAIHSVVFGGFAPHELALRINDAQPKALLSASCGIEFDKVIPYVPLLEAALQEAEHQPEHIVVYQREVFSAHLPEAFLDWNVLLAQEHPPAACVEVEAGHPLYILYTSGTTGKPKGIVRDNGGHAVAMHFSMEMVYGMKPGDTFWAASDLGWAVGHS